VYRSATGKLNLGVLLAIVTSMILLSILRRLPTGLLLALGPRLDGALARRHGLGLGAAGSHSRSPRSSSRTARCRASRSISRSSLGLAIMVLGWVFGRHMVQFDLGKARVAPGDRAAWSPESFCSPCSSRCASRHAGYGDMFLPRTSSLCNSGCT
jgi:hypothetical protein